MRASGAGVPASCFKRMAKARACPHPLRDDESARFCAVCGKPAWLEAAVGIDGFDMDNPEVFRGLPVAYPGEGEDAILCIRGGHAEPDGYGYGGYGRVEMPGDIDARKEELFAVMRGAGMGGFVKRFGLWALMYGRC